VSSSGTGTDAKPKGLLKTIAFAAEKYHYIVRRLPGYTPKAVGTCTRIIAFLSNGFSRQKRACLLARSWREQTSHLSHHRHRAPLAFVSGPLLLTALDPLVALRQLCDRYGLWLHVDGAYGAPAILSKRYRQELEPIALADSVALDPHKWLYVPVEAGLVLIRDGQAMRDTFSAVPPYLRNDGQTSGIFGLPWFSEYGVQQTRAFRALKVWMSLKHHGLAGYAEAIERDIALAEHLAHLVDTSEDLQRLASGLSIVCFRYAPPQLHADEERLDTLNKALLEALQLSGQAFLSSTTLDGTFVLRACIINPRTSAEDLERLVALVRDLGVQLARGGT
jgi:aromatic-L-amino-acid/L-tryptophan decarboxylase